MLEEVNKTIQKNGKGVAMGLALLALPGCGDGIGVTAADAGTSDSLSYRDNGYVDKGNGVFIIKGGGRSTESAEMYAEHFSNFIGDHPDLVIKEKFPQDSEEPMLGDMVIVTRPREKTGSDNTCK